MQLAPRLWQFWWLRGYLGEGRSWLERALATAPPADAPLVALAEFGLGKLCSDLGDYPAAGRHFRACVALQRDLGNMAGIAEGLTSLAVVALNLRDYGEAQELGEEALSISRQHGDARVTGRVLHDLAMVAREQGDYARARQLYEESMTIWRPLGDLVWIAFVALGLGITHLLSGRHEDARARLDEAQNLYERLGDRYSLAVVATELAHVARGTGDNDRAIILFGQALGHATTIGASEVVVQCVEWLATCAAERNDPVLALHLFGAVEAARELLSLPPRGDRDARMLAAGTAMAKKAVGADSESLFVAGHALTLDQARDAALDIVAQVTGEITTNECDEPD